MIGITYHEDYNKYDLGLEHPLIGDKPKRTIEYQKKQGLLENIKIFKPIKATEEEILRAHTLEYLNRVKNLSKKGGMLSFDTPAPIGIYDIARTAVGGSILAGKKINQGYNCIMNPLGGFHHASRNFSSGFCFFNDIAVLIEDLRAEHNYKKFLIIDLDVHHGNGTQEIYFDDPSVLNISFHQDGNTLYPGTGSLEKIGRNSGEGYTINLPLPPKTGNKSYLYAFNEIIPSLAKQFKPDVIIYQCGVDTHHSDPLADLRLTHQIYYNLAKKIYNLSKKTCNKLIVLYGGGYNSEKSIISYHNITCGILEKENYIREKELKDENFEKVKKIVNKLKNRIEKHWEL